MATVEEKRHMDRLAQLGCIVCRNNGYPDTPCEIQHIIDMFDRERNHLRVIPLCPIHHRTGLLHPPHIAKMRTGWDRWREVGYHQAPKVFAKRYGAQRDLRKQVHALLGIKG